MVANIDDFTILVRCGAVQSAIETAPCRSPTLLTAVFRLMQGRPLTGDPFEDVRSLCGPKVGFGVLAGNVDVDSDGLDRLSRSRKIPRLRRLSVMSREKRATIFSHQAGAGVRRT